MNRSNLNLGIRDKGGRRSGIERRKVITPGFSPERRSGQDRRKNGERRTEFIPENVSFLKRGMDRYLEYTNAHRGMGYAVMLSLLIWAGLILFLLFKILF